MTITLSPETEADIRELLRLWGWDAGDQVLAEATARAALVNGLSEAIGMTRELDVMKCAAIERLMKPQSIPDARVFEEPYTWYHQANRAGKAMATEPPNIADGMVVQTAGGRLLEWRGGKWWAKEEGGAK